MQGQQADEGHVLGSYLGGQTIGPPHIDRVLVEMSTDLTWQELEDITDYFSKDRIVGSGGYGVVYKGVHQNGQEIAVKKLYHFPGLDEKQFQNEFQILTRLCHKNIVRLVGKSYEEQDRCVEYNGNFVVAKMVDRAICLEYLHNGSLEKHISAEDSGLHWHRRYKIIQGICEGLKYLHDNRIFHLDLKPANILLDNNMEPKITDFGLSRLFSGTRKSHTTTHFIGTLGYVPPEYIEKGKISDKFDIFSLGVIIIGILTGPNGYSEYSDMPLQDFIEQVHGNWRKRLLNDAELDDASYLNACCNQVKACIDIAINCPETNRHSRSSIGDIICTLNGTVNFLALGHVIGDVVDPFITSASMRIFYNSKEITNVSNLEPFYNNKEITNVSNLKPSQVMYEPRVQISGRDLRTLLSWSILMHQAPVPLLKERTFTGRVFVAFIQAVEWLVTDIPETTDYSFCNEIVPYERPRPTFGIHRFVFILFRQSGRQTIYAPEWRVNFNTRDFAELYNLGSPVAAAYFNCCLREHGGCGGRRSKKGKG